MSDASTRGLSPRELEKLSTQFNAILDYVQRLAEVDTEGVQPDPGAPVGRSSLRPDEPGECLDPREALANAPDPYHAIASVPWAIEYGDAQFEQNSLEIIERLRRVL